jgi:hypothetical protein
VLPAEFCGDQARARQPSIGFAGPRLSGVLVDAGGDGVAYRHSPAVCRAELGIRGMVGREFVSIQ